MYLFILLAFGGWVRLDYDGAGRMTYRDTATISASASDSTIWLDLSYSNAHSIFVMADTISADTLNYIVYYRTAPVKPILDSLLENRLTKIAWTVLDTIIGTDASPGELYPLILEMASVIQFKVKAVVEGKVFLWFREE